MSMYCQSCGKVFKDGRFDRCPRCKTSLIQNFKKLEKYQLKTTVPGDSRDEIHSRGGYTDPQMASAAQRIKRRREREEGSIVFNKADDSTEAEILIFGHIGSRWDEEDTSAFSFATDVIDLGELTKLTIRINSGGGSVFDATAIYNTIADLVNDGVEVFMRIQGVAASAATVIPMAGTKITMAENAHMMIHNARGGVWGTADEMLEYVALLQRVNASIRQTYTGRTGISDSDLVDIMAKDFWINAEEALELGFIDAIDNPSKVTPAIKPNAAINIAACMNFPASRLGFASEQLATFESKVSSIHVPAGDPPAITIPARSTPVQGEEIKMDPTLRDLCIKAGMDSSLSDAEAQTWLAANLAKVSVAAVAPAPGPGGVDGTPSPAPAVVVANPAAPVTGTVADNGGTQIGDARITELLMTAMAARDNQRRESIATFRGAVDSYLELAFDDRTPTEVRAACYDLYNESSPTNLEDVRVKIQEIKREQAQSPSPAAQIRFADNQPRDVGRQVVGTALMMRCFHSAGMDAAAQERHLPVDQRANGWERLQNVRPIELCAEALRVDGFSNQIAGFVPWQIAAAAMGFHRYAGLTAEGGLGYHSTGTLSFLTQDAINKTLRAGYEEARTTWEGPGRRAEPASDFKQIHRIKLSAAPNLPVWNDNTVPAVAALANEEEKYAVEAYAEEISYTWQMFVNDDMSFISRTPFMLGAAAARTVNATYWAQVTSNPTLSDGQALFLASAAGNRKRVNLVTGAAVPSIATLGAMKNKMRQMRGLNTPEGNESDDILNLMPRYIIGPTALETTIKGLIRSVGDPADNKSSAAHNVFGPQAEDSLIPVIEPLLDANSATAWYLSADPRSGGVDTVEVTFLAGQESPVTNQWIEQRTMSHVYTIVQTFAAKALDHRGLQKNAGA